MFGNSNFDDVCEPTVFVHNLQESCSELRYKIFDYFFPLISLPAKYQEAYEKADYKEKCKRSIYQAFYQQSDFGEKKVMKFDYEKEKSQYASMRKYAPFEDSETPFSEFLEQIQDDGDFTLRVYFPNATKVDLDPFENSGFSKSKADMIDINDCLEKFRVEELLTDDNKYYCRECKEHQDTYKKMDIYKLPKILVIQLKRFSKGGGGSKYGGGYGLHRMVMGSSKNSDLIDFPIDGLDMGQYLLEKDGKEYNYDLYAISNHMGSLYGGHYTAHCKNSLDNKWYYFNDSSCGKTSTSELVCSSAYVLFYRLRE